MNADLLKKYRVLEKVRSGLKNNFGVAICLPPARALVICVAAALVLAGMVDASSPVLSNSGGGTWQDFIEINIKENSGSTLKDYQVLVQLSGTDFPINAHSDGSDIRFTDTDENELNYWIESWDIIDGMSLLNVNDGKYSGETITEKFPTSFEVLGMARSAEKTEAFRQYVHKLNNSENIPDDNLYLQLYSWVGETHYIDWTRVRKYTSAEPTLTFISEKTQSDWKLFAGAIIVTVLIFAIILQKRSTRKNSKNDIPNILLSITSNKGFKVGTWEKLDVNISNVGNGIAKNIEVKLLGPIETSGNKTVEILKGRGNQT